MTRMTTMVRATRSALAVMTMASTALALSACDSLGRGDSSAASTGSSASADAEGTAPTGGNGVRSKPSSDASTPAASQSPKAGASASPGGLTGGLAEPATPPEGYQTATAETAGVTFALPADWHVYSTLDDAEITEIAARLETDTSTVSSSTRLQDLLAIAGTRDSNGLLEHAACVSIALPLGVVDEATLSENVTEDGSTVEKYSTIDTANGTGSYIIFNDAGYDGTVKSANLYLPNPSGSMVLLRLSSSSSERTQQLVDTVAATLR